jgi:hypothetical protein
MALAPRVLYGTQTANSLAWGLTPFEDQQLAGIIMWVRAGTIYAGTVPRAGDDLDSQAGMGTRRSDVACAYLKRDGWSWAPRSEISTVIPPPSLFAFAGVRQHRPSV